MNKVWSDIAWDEYLYWQQTDRKIAKKINELIKDIERNGLSNLHSRTNMTRKAKERQEFRRFQLAG